MTIERTSNLVLKWSKEMGLLVPDEAELQGFLESLNDPAMKGALLHLVQHVRPKQEVMKINRELAVYGFLKTYPANKEVDVSIHKPEDVTLFKKREKLKQVLQEKRNEEAMLDEEIRKAQKLLKNKKLTVLSLRKTVKSKEHKSNVLKVKFEETKAVITKMSDTNERINCMLNSKNEESDEDTALVLIKQSIKELMISDHQIVDLDSDFWITMRQELQSHSPRAVIGAVLSFCQDLCSCADSLVYNLCEERAVADFSEPESELASLRLDLEQTWAEYEKAEALSEDRSNRMNDQLENIIQLLIKDDSDPDISRFKMERMREILDRDNLEAQLKYVMKHIDDMEVKALDLESDDTLHSLNEMVHNAISDMEAQAQSVRDYVTEFSDLSRVFTNLKLAQDQSSKVAEESLAKLASTKVRDFQNKLVQVHTMLAKLSDECFSNNVDKFPVECNSVDFKQIHHSLTLLSTLREMKTLPDVTVERELDPTNGDASCKLPHPLSEEALEEFNAQLNKLKEMFRALSFSN